MFHNFLISEFFFCILCIVNKLNCVEKNYKKFSFWKSKFKKNIMIYFVTPAPSLFPQFATVIYGIVIKSISLLIIILVSLNVVLQKALLLITFPKDSESL